MLTYILDVRVLYCTVPSLYCTENCSLYFTVYLSRDRVLCSVQPRDDRLGLGVVNNTGGRGEAHYQVTGLGWGCFSRLWRNFW